MLATLLVLAVPLWLPSPAAQAGRGWAEYVADDGEYSVKMPGTPRKTIQRAESNLGKVSLSVVMSEYRSSLFAVYYQEDFMLEGEALDGCMDNIRDGHKAGKHGRIVSERKITIAGRPGRDIAIESPATAVSPTSIHRIRLIPAGTRLYQLMVVTPKGSAGAAKRDVDAFFTSFSPKSSAPAPGMAFDEAAPVTWNIYRSPGGAFSVSLPGTPTEKLETNDSRPGVTAVHLVTSPAEGKTFTVSYYDESTARGSKTVLDAARDATIEERKATLIRETKVSMGRNPGREFAAKVDLENSPGGGILRCKVYQVGRRTYAITAVVPKGEEASAAVEAYFKSFKLITTK
jgi:hypothetical protein